MGESERLAKRPKINRSSNMFKTPEKLTNSPKESPNRNYACYVVWRGRKPGIYSTWQDCSEQVKGFSNNTYKGFYSYDEALTAFESKCSSSVKVPKDLVPSKFPHYMGRADWSTYKSKSFLGEIFDRADAMKLEEPKVQVWKIPNFDVEIPESHLRLWKDHYNSYRKEMKDACSSNGESKNEAAEDVMQKYKQDEVRRTTKDPNSLSKEDVSDEGKGDMLAGNKSTVAEESNPNAKLQREYNVLQGFAKALWNALKEYKERVKGMQNEIVLLTENLSTVHDRYLALEKELRDLKSRCTFLECRENSAFYSSGERSPLYPDQKPLQVIAPEEQHKVSPYECKLASFPQEKNDPDHFVHISSASKVSALMELTNNEQASAEVHGYLNFVREYKFRKKKLGLIPL